MEKVQFDMKLMKNALKGLRFNVQSFSDLDRMSMLENIIVNIVEADFSDSSCVLFYFSGHGSNGNICGTDWGKLNILEQIITPIGLKNTLRGKPKLFLFDCCRTNDPDTVRPSFSLPPDVYVAYATSPYDTAYDGAWSQHLALGLLEGCFYHADRWITSIHNVLTFARVKTFKRDRQLSVSGEDTLLKLFFFKDCVNSTTRFNEELHGHYLSKPTIVDEDDDEEDDERAYKARCSRCDKYRECFKCQEDDCDYNVCNKCIVDFESIASQEDEELFKRRERRHQRIIENMRAADEEEEEA